MGKTKSTKATRKMTSAELADALLHSAHKMPTIKMATKRAALLRDAFSALEDRRLPYCYGDARCGLLSCPRCRLRNQRVFMLKTIPLVCVRSGSSAWGAITIIPRFGRTEVGELPKGGLRGFGDQIKAAIRKIHPEAVAEMCVDISLERLVGGREYWQWHVHGVIFKPQPDSLDKLRPRFTWQNKGSDNGSCYRPFQVEEMEDSVRWLAYCSKPEFYVRVQQLDAEGGLEFVKKKVTIQQELHFVKVLSDIKVGQRFFRIGKGITGCSK